MSWNLSKLKFHYRISLLGLGIKVRNKNSKDKLKRYSRQNVYDSIFPTSFIAADSDSLMQSLTLSLSALWLILITVINIKGNIVGNTVWDSTATYSGHKWLHTCVYNAAAAASITTNYRFFWKQSSINFLI